MVEDKTYSEKYLINSYSSCFLFKKYYKYDLWFGSFYEYHNIKYCKKYIQKYIYCWIHIFLGQRFSLSFVIILYKSPRFIKFIESGFFKYLDSNFLLLFSKNCFTFRQKGEQEIKNFVKSYFYSDIKKSLEKDFLVVVNKVINETIFNFFIKHLISHLKKIHICDVKNIKLKDKISFSKKNKKYLFCRGLIFFNYLIEKGYYLPCFIFSNYYHLVKVFYSFISLSYKYFSLRRDINFKSNTILKFNLKSTNANDFIIKRLFIKLPQKTCYEINKEIHYLIESFESLDDFIKPEKKIGLYKKTNITVKKKLSVNDLKLNKSFKNFFNSFNNSFVRFKYKRKF